MRINDRKVNGRIKLEREDTIQTFAIVVGPEGCVWADGIDEAGEIIKLPNSVAGAAINAKLGTLDPILITVINQLEDTMTLLFPSYVFNSNTGMLSIDLGEIKPGKTLEIAIPSGAITVK